MAEHLPSKCEALDLSPTKINYDNKNNEKEAAV
jgi:hypothetical protein